MGKSLKKTLCRRLGSSETDPEKEFVVQDVYCEQNGRKWDWAEEGAELRCRPSKVWTNLVGVQEWILFINVSRVRMKWPCSEQEELDLGQSGSLKSRPTQKELLARGCLLTTLPVTGQQVLPWRRIWLLCLHVNYFTKHCVLSLLSPYPPPQKKPWNLFKLFIHQGNAN